jgi:hypothetical protein
MESQILTQSDLNLRIQSLYNIIDEGLTIGIEFPTLEEAVEAYCQADLIEPSEYGCETFSEVADLLLEQRPHLYEYPNC